MSATSARSDSSRVCGRRDSGHPLDAARSATAERPQPAISQKVIQIADARSLLLDRYSMLTAHASQVPLENDAGKVRRGQYPTVLLHRMSSGHRSAARLWGRTSNSSTTLRPPRNAFPAVALISSIRAHTVVEDTPCVRGEAPLEVAGEAGAEHAPICRADGSWAMQALWSGCGTGA